MARESTPQTIHRKDYRKPEYTIDSVELLFQIEGSVTSVSASLQIRRIASKPTPLVLHGEGLRLKAIQLDGKALSEDQYRAGNETLVIDTVPEQFELATTVELHPAENTALEGLYQSGRFLLTQCEGPGIPKDHVVSRPTRCHGAISGSALRPNSPRSPSFCPMATFRKAASWAGDATLLPGMTRFANQAICSPWWLATWNALPTPFRAPTAGPSTCGCTRRRKNVDKLDYAMASLKRSMRWDEERFGLIYDLDVYNIVATNDFNMGRDGEQGSEYL